MDHNLFSVLFSQMAYLQVWFSLSGSLCQRPTKTELPVIQHFAVPSVRQAQRAPMKRILSKTSGRKSNASKAKLIRLWEVFLCL